MNNLIEQHKQIQKIELFKYFLEKELSLRMIVTSPTQDYINGIRVDFIEENLKPVISFDLIANENIFYLYISFIKIRNKVQKRNINEYSLNFILADLIQIIKEIETLYGNEINKFENSSEYQQYLNDYENWLLTVQNKFNKRLIDTMIFVESKVDKNSYEYDDLYDILK